VGGRLSHSLGVGNASGSPVYWIPGVGGHGMQANTRIGQPDGAGLLDLERWMSIGDESVAEKKCPTEPS